MNFHKETPPIILSKYDIEFFGTFVEKSYFLPDAHIHPAIEFLYITKGDFEIYIDGVISKAETGDLVLIRSNAIHSIYHPSDDCGEYYVIKLTTQYLFNIFKGVENYACILAFLKNEKNNKIIFKARELSCDIKNIFDKMIKEYNSNDDMMLLTEKAYICIFIISVYRTFFLHSCENDDKYISKDMIALLHESVEYINLNYASDISAAGCAKKANLSYSYFAKLFRTIIGKSFKEYLTALRLAKAHNILISTDFPITDVALSCGYNSHAYFTAEYKKYYGKTPTETRKRK